MECVPTAITGLFGCLARCCSRSQTQHKPLGGGMTTGPRSGSHFLLLCMTPLISVGCGAASEADPAISGVRQRPTIEAPREGVAREGVAREPEPPAEACLGVPDKGIWSDLDE